MFGYSFRHLELGGGIVDEAARRLVLPPIAAGYGDAQVDDYGRFRSRSSYSWQPGSEMRLTARFSHDAGELLGTAGFGFWNAPFGDPTIRFPALPQTTWFFFASSPTNLPYALPEQPGRGWFAATLDGATLDALALAPLSPFILLLNQFSRLRRSIWPLLRKQLGISFAPISTPMSEWHTYRLQWRGTGCTFFVDETHVLETPHSPHGPLGFVCWIDNQYMVARVNGRFSWGTLSTEKTQWLELGDLVLHTF